MRASDAFVPFAAGRERVKPRLIIGNALFLVVFAVTQPAFRHSVVSTGGLPLVEYRRVRYGRLAWSRLCALQPFCNFLAKHYLPSIPDLPSDSPAPHRPA